MTNRHTHTHHNIYIIIIIYRQVKGWRLTSFSSTPIFCGVGGGCCSTRVFYSTIKAASICSGILLLSFLAFQLFGPPKCLPSSYYGSRDNRFQGPGGRWEEPGEEDQGGRWHWGVSIQLEFSSTRMWYNHEFTDIPGLLFQVVLAVQSVVDHQLTCP